MAVRGKRSLLALVGISLLAAGTRRAGPSDAAPSEYEVKAAYIYHFSKFVEWPPDPPGESGPFLITVLGRDPFGRVLDDALRDKTVENRKVVLRRVSRVEEVGGSQILFISDSERERLSPILKRVERTATLTVGEMDHFATLGGVIGFRLEGDRVRLEVSVAAAERSRLRINSQLLRVARIVDPGSGR